MAEAVRKIIDVEKSLSSEVVQMQVINDQIGKGLFAIKDFKVGDIIFEEKPLISCQFLWNAAYGYLACDFCLRPLETAEENVRRLSSMPEISLPYPESCNSLIPIIHCPHCNESYCSEDCRQNAWNHYHKRLCYESSDSFHPLLLLQETWKQMHYPPETASIMLLARIFAMVNQAEDKEDARSQVLNFCHRTINEEDEIVHKLLGSEFQVQLESLRELMGKVFPEAEFYTWLTSNGFRSLFALIGTNGQGIGTSPLSQWVKHCDAMDLPPQERDKIDKFTDDLYEKLENEAGSFLNSEGSGLYALQSSCNHSCNPNAMSTFPRNNFQLQMIALKDITAGEEICVSYLDECNLDRSRHSRVKALRENYLFTCKCSKCEEELEDAEDITSEEDMESEEEEAAETN